ncbi:MAG: P1 family peptidase [Burkholderiaceae bacterium]|nr:P1 family peptidase [Burkholderiaceae bacterium]
MAGALTDVAGLHVGHHTLATRATGCTVVLCPEGAVAGVDVRGGAPGTRETDLLRPENVVQVVHGVLLTGGSAFGLAAADGVVRWLESRGHGLEVGPVRVPIVPAAVIFDLWEGDPSVRPDAAAGSAACDAASTAAPAVGAVGAGAGATVGKLWGPASCMRGGLGTASITVHGVTVGALMVVNAVGDVFDTDGSIIAGARGADGRARRSTDALAAGELPQRLVPGTATTIGVVATDAVLDKGQATKLAVLGHAGLARSVDPLTMHDGDTLFALATGRAGRGADLSLLGALAARVVAEAIRSGVRAAQAPVSRQAHPKTA